MKFIPLDTILVPADRQRQEHPPEDHAALVNSILNTGLLHPIVVRQAGPAAVLVAGERRLRAIRDLWDLGQPFLFDGRLCNSQSREVPCVDLGELSELSTAEAEYDENDKRLNITWQEKAAATARLAHLRGLQATNAGLPPPTAADLAAELRGSSKGSAQGDTRKELVVAQHFARPEVAGAKTLDDAFKWLKQEEEKAKNVALAEKIGATYSAATAHRLHNADACEWLVGCDTAAFDVILCDAPYGMGADEFGDSGRMQMQEHDYADSPETLLHIVNICVPHIYRVAKPQAHLYWFCDLDWYADLKLRFEVAGWKVHRTPLIWHKPNGARAPWPDQGPQRKYEIILYAVKGNRPTQQLAGDVLSYSLEANAKLGAQKPVDLYKELLKRSARPGDTVADFFCGTGPIFPAAHALKLFATGIEKSPATYAIAAGRLEGLK